ncbi:hypothetical protein [Yoonia sp. SS1-5]|uniref:Alpha/beta hydrolase n=1 Tax=Yoonia rhodophyticola TaxID=3137370 RepID=A0AAN0NHP8_9RHOB
MQADRLVVLIRGWTDGDEFFLKPEGHVGGRFPEAFVDFVDELHTDGELLQPKFDTKAHDMSGFSLSDPADLVAHVLKAIETKLAEKDFAKITIAGFSTGALFARAVLVEANGIGPDGNFDPKLKRPWADKIDRWISMAGILRGWTISSSTSIGGRMLGPGLVGATKLWGMLNGGKLPLVSAVEQGMPFVVNTRLRQIELEKILKDPGDQRLTHGLPLMINLLGTRDQFISPSDCIEPSPPEEHVFLEVPSTNHLRMLDVSSDTQETAARRKIIKLAFTSTEGDIKARTGLIVERDDLNDFFDELDRPETDLLDDKVSAVKHAVIVLHGIRDHGFWTKRIAKRIKSRGVRTLFRAPSPSYGYFSVLDFLNPWRRKKQARWLLQQYADVRSCFRDAEISFVGHSNGTYLFKEVMALSSAVRFKHVYLAGSVLRRDLHWDRFAAQIEGDIVNVKSAGDWVVGCLPSAMERLGLRFLDVGGAGYFGFTNPPQSNRLFERDIEGSHNAGVSEKSWQAIADFVVDDKIQPQTEVTSPRGLQGLVFLAPALLIAMALFFVVVLDRLAVLLSHILGPVPSVVASVSAGTADGSVQLGFVVLLLLAFGRVARIF